CLIISGNMEKDKKKEEKKENVSELAQFLIRPLEYCEPMSLAELLKEENKDKEEETVYYS
ncbi:MAG: hypothetical protein PUI58_01230, partial [Solobacterium sp.]|nr:hypothetical protein [Solobacterium sp.]